MQRNWKRADGERETEPALEQWCKVTVLKRTLTGENLHAFRQMDAQKKHTQLHPDKNLRYLRGCSCVTDTYMYCKSKQTVLPNSISTCFLIPLLAALVCVWLKLLLPVYLPSEKLNQNQQKCLLAGKPSLYRVSLSSTLILWTEVKKGSSFLGQWHILAVIQTAAAKQRYICASIKKGDALCWSRCPLWGGGGEKGWGRIEERRRRKERLRVWWWESGEQVCILLCVSMWRERESERASGKEGEERELEEDWLLTTWTSHLPSSTSSSQHHFLFRVHTCTLP